MPIIRKRLTETELQNPNVRVNPETGAVQSFVNGGWVDNPSIDPRINTILPPRTGDNHKCNTAASQVRYIQDWVETTTNGISQGLSGLAVAGLLLGLAVAPFYALALLALAVFEVVVGIGVTTVSGAFTTMVYDQLLCIFFCESDENGNFDAVTFEAMRDQIDVQIGGIAAVVLQAILPVIGYGGLNTQGAAGLDEDDCSGCDCGCTGDYDFTIEDWGWTPVPGRGTYVTSTGWRAQFDGSFTQCYIKLPCTSFSATSLVEIDYNIPVNSGLELRLLSPDESTVIATIYSTGGISGTGTVQLIGNNSYPNPCVVLLSTSAGGSVSPQTFSRIFWG